MRWPRFGGGGGLVRQPPVAWPGTCDTATDKEKSSAPSLLVWALDEPLRRPHPAPAKKDLL